MQGALQEQLMQSKYNICNLEPCILRALEYLFLKLYFLAFYFLLPPPLHTDPEQLLAMQAMMPDEEAMMNLAIALSLVIL